MSVMNERNQATCSCGTSQDLPWCLCVAARVPTLYDVMLCYAMLISRHSHRQLVTTPIVPTTVLNSIPLSSISEVTHGFACGHDICLVFPQKCLRTMHMLGNRSGNPLHACNLDPPSTRFSNGQDPCASYAGSTAYLAVHEWL